MPNQKIVNVATVPKRSPFRYAGGKTWLVPKARAWMKSFANRPKVFIEPFAGGGIISLTVAFENLADHVVMCELDPDVAAVWRYITSSDFEKLAHRIIQFEVSEENVKSILAGESTDDSEKAFRTIIKNRMFHGGILAPGASLMKSGENGKGLSSRWYAKTLSNRIVAIGELRHRFTVIEGDGIALIKEYRRRKATAAFIDPPYTAAGKKAGSRLYRYCELDHEELFLQTSRLQGDFLMTYDNAEGVKSLAKLHDLDTEPIAMKNTHHAEMTELLIGRDLRWARQHVDLDSQMQFSFE